MGAALACWNGDNNTPDGCKRRHDHTNNHHLYHDDEQPANCWDASSTASSGSRLLSAFYSRWLAETSGCAFYVDARGTRLAGPYLDRIELVDNYFAPRWGATAGCCLVSLRAARADVASDDCVSTSSTLTSERDYWTASLGPLELRERRHGTLPPVLGRSASVGPPADARVTIHRARTSPQLQDDVDAAYARSPWRSRLGNCAAVASAR